MKIPPLLLAAAVLFWGMESGNGIVGLSLGLPLGMARFISPHWRFTDEDFARISDLTSIVFLTVASLVLLNVKAVVFLKTLIVWMPLTLLPLILAQLYSTNDKIIIGTHLSFRRKKIYKHNPVDFRFYYLSACLFSAAVANSRSPFFFPVSGLLIVWLLFVNRGKSFSLVTFLLVSMIPLGCGYYGYKGAEHIHEYLSSKTRSFISSYYDGRSADPFQSHLSFGDIGALKSSGRIILRLRSRDKSPRLLRQASYETYSRQSWYSKRPFEYLAVSNSGWDLLPPPNTTGTRQVTVEYYLPKEKGLLPHPYGSYRVVGQTIYELEQKNDGITRIIDGAPLVTYDILYNPELVRKTDQPTARTLTVSPGEQKVLEQIAAKIAVEDLTVKKRVKAVENFFADGFSYSLGTGGNDHPSASLENFLLVDRTGHCELFATATALLLRKVGVPSRYVTGFAVAEYSKLENKFIIRERHAHAWSEAFVNGRWIVVDTTPADWFHLEGRNRSRFEKVQDILAYLKLQYDHFRMGAEQKYTQALSVVIVLLACLLMYLIYRRMSGKNNPPAVQQYKKVFDSIDSPFYQVENELREMEIPRHKTESFLQWVMRIHGERDIDLQTVLRLYSLHQKLRFDPEGLSAEEQILLVEKGEEWLDAYARPIIVDQKI
jgi:protein-glutamine gamma-glutamyltransferase